MEGTLNPLRFIGVRPLPKRYILNCLRVHKKISGHASGHPMSAHKDSRENLSCIKWIIFGAPKLLFSINFSSFYTGHEKYFFLQCEHYMSGCTPGKNRLFSILKYILNAFFIIGASKPPNQNTLPSALVIP